MRMSLMQGIKNGGFWQPSGFVEPTNFQLGRPRNGSILSLSSTGRPYTAPVYNSFRRYNSIKSAINPLQFNQPVFKYPNPYEEPGRAMQGAMGITVAEAQEIYRQGEWACNELFERPKLGFGVLGARECRSKCMACRANNNATLAANMALATGGTVATAAPTPTFLGRLLGEGSAAVGNLIGSAGGAVGNVLGNPPAPAAGGGGVGGFDFKKNMPLILLGGGALLLLLMSKKK